MFPDSSAATPSGASEYGLGHGFVVYVRHEDDEGLGAGRIYGIYERRSAAERKADAINKRLGDAEVAGAYAIPLGWGNTPAEHIAREALGG